MNRHHLATISALALVSALTAPVAHAGPAAKKLTVAQLEKKIDTAITQTTKWQRTNPFVITAATRENGVSSTEVYTIDKAGGISIDDQDGAVAIIIGRESYVPLIKRDLAPFEVALARELGLDMKAKWVKTGPVTTNSVEQLNFELNQVRAQVRPQRAMFEAVYPKRSTITSLVSGKSETIKVSTMAFVDDELGSVPASVMTFTTTGGRLTEYLSSSNGVVRSITYKPYAGRIKAPLGPYFDGEQLFAHPSYPSAYATHRGQLTLDAMVRQAFALAAFEGRTELNTVDWAEVAERFNGNLYDKGVGFHVVFDTSRSFSLCAEFTSDGATLRSSSCEELGFLKL